MESTHTSAHPLRAQPVPTSILVASDLSASSDRIVIAASRLAHEAGADLHVISVYNPPVSGMKLQEAALPEAVQAEIRQALPAQLRRILPADSAPTSAEVRLGEPADRILQRAAEVDASMIVLGTHRGTDLNAQFLGTTADAVLRRSPIPSLAIRGSVQLPMRRIGVATDLAHLGKVATSWAVAWAGWLAGGEGEDSSSNPEIRLVHVAGNGNRSAAERDLQLQLEEAASGDGIRMIARVLDESDPSSALPRWAAAEAIDLLVLAYDPEEQRDRDRLGTVASALALRAPCPVLFVPAPSGES
jgi:nucleotide-binding universal stress UspA family protein